MKKILIYILFFTAPIISLAQTTPSSTSSAELGQLINQIQTDLFSAESIKSLFDENTNMPAGYSDAISVNISSAQPKPNEKVTISTESTLINLSLSKFSWYVDDKLIESGMGKSSFSFITKELGKKSRVKVVINKDGGGVFERTISVVPTELDMYYEAQTTSFPFFLGKPQFTYQSAIKIIANPRALSDTGELIPANDWVYRWSINDKVIQAASGYGKNTMLYRDSIFSETAKIEVSAVSRVGNIGAIGKIILKPQTPKIVLYEDNPLYGIVFSSALSGNKTLERDEVKLVAVPFSFDKNNYVNYDWYMNDSLIEGNKSGSITLRKEANGGGTSKIGVEGKISGYLLQRAGEYFDLNFGDFQGVNNAL